MNPARSALSSPEPREGANGPMPANWGRISAALLAALALAGCAGIQPGEKAADDQVSQIGRLLPPWGRAAVSQLSGDSSLRDFERFAALNHPAVAAAYLDWRASVEAIEPSRTLPDPQLVFEADIADTLKQFMPGLMFDLTSAGKRSAMAREATASSRVAYRTYVSAVFTVASDVRATWIELAYLDDAVRLQEASLGVLGQAANVAEADYATGRGMATLESQVRLANEKARVQSLVESLRHQITSTRSQLKSNLGLLPTDPDPAWPHPLLVATILPAEDVLWRRVRASNPSLAQMRAVVEMAVASVEVARSAGTPDFSAGAMVDLKASPLLIRPLANVSLPIWRSKIAAMVATAEAKRDAAVARVGAEQLNMAARLAQMLHMVRDSDHTIAYVDGTALPNLERTLAAVEAGYQSGMNGLSTIPETRLTALAAKLDRAAALRDREIAVTDLLLMAAEVAPAGSPVLAENSAP